MRVLSGIFVLWIGSVTAFSIEQFDADEFTSQCISRDDEIRRIALSQLIGATMVIDQFNPIFKMLKEKVQVKLDVPNQPRPEVMPPNRKELIINGFKDINIAIEVLTVLSNIDNEDAKRFALSNLSFNPGFFLTNASTLYMFGLPVSSYPIPKAVIESEKITFDDVMQFITDTNSTFHFQNTYEAFAMYVFIMKMKQKGLNWEEAKKNIKESIDKYWDSAAIPKNPEQASFIQTLLKTCGDPEFTEIKCMRYGLEQMMGPNVKRL